MGVNETRFAEIIWEKEPISSSALIRQAEERLHWKKSTSYTVLKRLCDKGIFRNDNGSVTSLISRKEFYAIQSENFVDDTFGGSLPAFLAAFTSRKSLTKEEAQNLQNMVAAFEED